jgi:hypothetical protein
MDDVQELIEAATQAGVAVEKLAATHEQLVEVVGLLVEEMRVFFADARCSHGVVAVPCPACR